MPRIRAGVVALALAAALGATACPNHNEARPSPVPGRGNGASGSSGTSGIGGATGEVTGPIGSSGSSTGGG